MVLCVLAWCAEHSEAACKGSGGGDTVQRPVETSPWAASPASRRSCISAHARMPFWLLCAFFGCLPKLDQCIAASQPRRKLGEEDKAHGRCIAW